MATTKSSNIGCKQSELIVICTYAAQMEERDAADFEGLSSRYSVAQRTAFKAKTEEARLLPDPTLLRDEGKISMVRMRETMKEVMDITYPIERYIKIANDDIAVANATFNLVELRRKIRNNDAEGVLQDIVHLKENLTKHSVALKAVGMPDTVVEMLSAAIGIISDEKAKQFELKNLKNEQTATNTEKLLSLKADLFDILATGKSIYRPKNPDKAKQYSFSYLLSQVRRTNKSASTEADKPATEEAPSTNE